MFIFINGYPLAQGLSLSGLDNEKTQKEAVTIMKSKFPDCSINYHMCVDTIGAITTASDKGWGKLCKY